MFFILVNLLGVLSVAYLIFHFVFQGRPKCCYPRGPLSLPIIGNLHQLTTHPFIKFMELRKTYGDIFAINLASYPAIVINGPKLIKEALSMAEFSGRPKLRPFVKACGGKPQGMVFNDGPVWAEHRRFILRNLRDFGFGKKSMEGFIHAEIELLLQTFSKHSGQVIETKNMIHLPVVNSLWRIIIGKRFDHEDPKLVAIVKLFTEGISDSPATAAGFFFPWLTVIAPELSGYNSVITFLRTSVAMIREAVLEEKNTFKPEGEEPRHFLDVYIRKVQEESDPDSVFYGDEGEKNLIMTVADMFNAGIETTSTSILWSFMMLTVYPDKQEKLFEELKSVIGLEKPVTLEDEKRLPYTQAVMTEVLRVCSLIPLALFHQTMDDVEFHGYKIPKGTIVMPNLYGVNFDPAIWGDPEAFRPERFLTDDGKYLKRPDQHMYSFSVGKRICPGEALARIEVFLFMTNIFKKFKVGPNPAKPHPVVDYSPTGVMQPKLCEYVLTPRV